MAARHQIDDAFAMDGADRENFVETEFVEFEGRDFDALSVDLISGDDYGFAGATKFVGDFAVEGNNTFLDVGGENDDVGGFDSEINLIEGGLGDDVGGFLAAEQADTAGIDEREGITAPFGFGGDAVAGDAGDVVDNGDAPAHNAIKQSRLADIRPAHDSDQT